MTVILPQTGADHEEAEGDDDGVFVLEEGGKLLLHRDLDLMLRRLDRFLELIGRPEERRQTDDDTDDDGQQIATRGLRGARRPRRRRTRSGGL